MGLQYFRMNEATPVVHVESLFCDDGSLLTANMCLLLVNSIR